MPIVMVGEVGPEPTPDTTPWNGWLRSVSGVMVKPSWYQEGEDCDSQRV